MSMVLPGSLDGQVLILQELLTASAKEPLQSNILSSSQSIIQQLLLDLSCLNAVTLWHHSSLYLFCTKANYFPFERSVTGLTHSQV